MLRRFGADSRRIVVGATQVATELDAPTLEAEHLLLAIARDPATPAHAVLVAAGLDYDAVREALDAEFEASLAAVGVSLGAFDLTATPAPDRVPRWGASAKLALERAVKIAESRRERRLGPGHIALALLRVPAGTVPRALDRAGIDRTRLGDRLAAVL